MKHAEFTLINKAGLHARPAAIFVRELKKYQSKIIIKKDGKEADGKNLFQIMSLGADYGDKIEVIIEGVDEDEAYNKVVELLTKVLPSMV